MRSPRLMRIVGLLGLVGLLAACDAQRGDDGASAEADQQATQAAPAADSPRTTRGRASLLEDLPDVVDASLPAVVGISTRIEADIPGDRGSNPFFDDFPFPFGPGPGGPGGPPGVQQGMGSGVIVSKEGYVLTNNHVVQNADEIRIQMHGDRQYQASIVGTDPQSELAVLKFDETPEDLQALSFANTEDIRLGEPVVAIGSPFGLSSTVTMGIISATGRQNVGIAAYEDFIQTDAAINPGNSGGPLINMEGEIVGINTAILSRSGGYQGIGFAIPSDMARSIMRSLIEEGEVSRGWLGVVIQTMNPDLAQALGLPENTDGVVISDVQPGSPADKAGLQRGDVIVSFTGTVIESASSLRNRVAMQSPGAEVELGVLRDGERRSVEVTLGRVPDQGSAAGQPPQDEPRSSSPLEGLQLTPLTPELRARLEVPDEIDGGLVVQRIVPGTPAARMGLQPGDVILEVNRTAVDSPGDFARAYERSEGRMLFLVFRDGNTLYMAAPKP